MAAKLVARIAALYTGSKASFLNRIIKKKIVLRCLNSIG